MKSPQNILGQAKHKGDLIYDYSHLDGNVHSPIHVFSENLSPGHLDTGEGRPCSQQLWSSGPAESKDCFRTWLSSLPKYEEVQKPVGGGAVDVDHVADAAFTLSFFLPETHGIGWC